MEELERVVRKNGVEHVELISVNDEHHMHFYKKLQFCGECREFPCETIMTQQHCTVLDKDWLLWKKNSNTINS